MNMLLKSFLRYLAQLAASEGGELLSVRRKAHLLEAERYARAGEEASRAIRKAAAQPGAAAARCRHLRRNAHTHASLAR